ncbi:hypothetical protein [Cyclobacterium amurskyense]|uniref:Lipoprotein n=1 Tax=Cyclobacterium amurskyense TaxID=320787 RepID=A0A0H4P8F0_9BACT|nr:hypothetical protein [Cyclobacterium amurskyense]AKP50741.1 hypothetical protein CA2015_1293 [Cyclobacterium amurskyense]
MKKIIYLMVLPVILLSCNKQKTVEITPTYFFQMYSDKDSKITKAFGREFGDTLTLNNKYVIDDSSAYVWAWKTTEKIHSSKNPNNEDNVLSSVNEFKLYDGNGVDITYRVSFVGIENYPNPIK